MCHFVYGSSLGVCSRDQYSVFFKLYNRSERNPIKKPCETDHSRDSSCECHAIRLHTFASSNIIYGLKEVDDARMNMCMKAYTVHLGTASLLYEEC